MTCIAYDGKTLAADKMASCNGLARTVTKIRRIDELRVGVTGDFDLAAEGFAWIEAGRKPDAFPAAMRDKEIPLSLLVIEDGLILKYERTPYPFKFEDKLFAMGSGRDYAMAAMYLGLSARKAVEVACEFETSCGLGVDELD